MTHMSEFNSDESTVVGDDIGKNGMSRITQALLGIFAAGFLAWAGVVWNATNVASSSLALLTYRITRIEERMATLEASIAAIRDVSSSVPAMERDYQDRFATINRRIDEVRAEARERSDRNLQKIEELGRAVNKTLR